MDDVGGTSQKGISEVSWTGVRGQETRFNKRPAKTSAGIELAQAAMYSTTPHMFEGKDASAYSRLAGQVRYPLFGTDCYAYGLLAIGFADLVVEAQLKPYDFCPIVPIVEGAGGRMTDWQGAPLGQKSDGRVLAAANSDLHAKALAALVGHE